jgi:hypothetical protein
MMTEPVNIAQRVFFALLPVMFTAIFGQGLYVLVWGIKLDTRVAQIEQALMDTRARLDRIDGTAQHNSTRATTMEEMLNSTQARLDTLIALMRVRERSDGDYEKSRRLATPPDERYKLQSTDADNPASSPP